MNGCSMIVVGVLSVQSSLSGEVFPARGDSRDTVQLSIAGDCLLLVRTFAIDDGLELRCIDSAERFSEEHARSELVALYTAVLDRTVVVHGDHPSANKGTPGCLAAEDVSFVTEWLNAGDGVRILHPRQQGCSRIGPTP